MQTFIGVIHKDDNSCFGIHFPDAPGCTSTGDTLEDVTNNAIEALSLYFEFADMVKARSIDIIRQEANEDIKEGAFLVAIPHVDFSGRSVRANITMDAGLLKGIDETAKKRGLTRSAFLAQVATKEVYGNNL